MALSNYYYGNDHDGISDEYFVTQLAEDFATLAQLQTANANGGIIGWIIPRWTVYGNPEVISSSPRRHFAWNPITFTGYHFVFNVGDYTNIPTGATQYSFQLGGTGDTYIAWHIETKPVIATLALSKTAITSESFTPDATLEAETINGIARINIAPIVRSWFSKPIDDPSNACCIKDTAQSVMVRILFDNNKGWCIQNAVSQAGEDGDKSFSTPILLTKNTSLVGWDEVNDDPIEHPSPVAPLSTDYINVKPIVSIFNRVANKTITYGGGSYSLDAFSVYRFYVCNADMMQDLKTAFGVFSTADGFSYEPSYNMETHANYCNPYPIRWLNRKGGIDQYVFTRREFKTKESQTDGLIEVYADDSGAQRSNRKPYAVSGSRTIKVGAERISADELDFLTQLPYSPQIEWYDVSQDDGLGRWIGVTVKKFSHTEQTDANTFDFEIEFECPAINMQFE